MMQVPISFSLLLAASGHAFRDQHVRKSGTKCIWNLPLSVPVSLGLDRNHYILLPYAARQPL